MDGKALYGQALVPSLVLSCRYLNLTPETDLLPEPKTALALWSTTVVYSVPKTRSTSGPWETPGRQSRARVKVEGSDPCSTISGSGKPGGGTRFLEPLCWLESRQRKFTATPSPGAPVAWPGPE